MMGDGVMQKVSLWMQKVIFQIIATIDLGPLKSNGFLSYIFYVIESKLVSMIHINSNQGQRGTTMSEYEGVVLMIDSLTCAEIAATQKKMVIYNTKVQSNLLCFQGKMCGQLTVQNQENFVLTHLFSHNETES